LVLKKFGKAKRPKMAIGGVLYLSEWTFNNILVCFSYCPKAAHEKHGFNADIAQRAENTS
jgi:hypothetical protein